MILTAALLAFTAYRTGRSPKRPDPADAEEPPPGEDPDFVDVVPPTPAGAHGMVAARYDRPGCGPAERPARRRRRDPDGPGVRRLGAAPDQGGRRLLARLRRHPRGARDDHPHAARPHRLGVRAPALHRGDPRCPGRRPSRDPVVAIGACDSRSRSSSGRSRSSTRSARSAPWCELAGAPEDRVDHRLGQLARERVLLARVEAAEDRGSVRSALRAGERTAAGASAG